MLIKQLILEIGIAEFYCQESWHTQLCMSVGPCRNHFFGLGLQVFFDKNDNIGILDTTYLDVAVCMDFESIDGFVLNCIAVHNLVA